MTTTRREIITTILGGCLWAALPLSASAAEKRLGLIIPPSPSPLPPLAITDGTGQPFFLTSLRGRAVLLNLWASWCMPCVAELPALDRLVPMVESEGISVVALSLDRGGATKAAVTYERLGVSHLALYLDTERNAGSVLGAPTLPTSLLITPDGKEAARFIGGAQWDGSRALALLRAVRDGLPVTADMAPDVVKLGGPAP